MKGEGLHDVDNFYEKGKKEKQTKKTKNKYY